MDRGKASIPYLALLLLLACSSWAWSSKVVSVADGDTIKVMRAHKQVKILLYGIDTPERGQPFGKKANQFTSDMVFGKIVEIEPFETASYGRTLALVRVDGVLLNEVLVKEGLAWVYPQCCFRPICNGWYLLEVKAHDGRQGLWADSSPVPPWEFRRKRRRQ